MKMLLRLFCLLPGLLFAQAIPLDGFAAMVNGRVITAGDVIEHTQSARRDARRRLTGRELALEQARIFELGLENLIEERLILEAFNAQSGTLPEGAVRERADAILRDRFNNNRSELLATLRAIGKSEQEWREELRQQIIVQQMTQQFVTRRIHITPRMLRDRFEADPNRFRAPLEVRLSAISLRPVPEAELPERQTFLETLRQQLLDGADFAATAREVSQGSNARQGGDMGWVNPLTLPPPLRDAIIELTPGEISPPVLTPTQHFLLKVQERRGGEVQSIASVQPQLESELRREEFDRLHNEWIASLKERFPVHRFNPREETIQRRN